VALHPIVCAVCGAIFDAATLTATTCSESCRSRRYRSARDARRADERARAEAIASDADRAAELLAAMSAALRHLPGD
jgi:predicted  nucleic acid-binding Zn-ribbon protein